MTRPCSWTRMVSATMPTLGRARAPTNQPSGWYIFGGRFPSPEVPVGSAVKYDRTLFEPEHELFRESYRSFLERHVAPFHDQWEKDKIVDRGVWLEAGKQG